MSWVFDYYSEEVRRAVDELPVGIRASYARLTELMEELGMILRMPHSRSLGDGLFELRPHGREGTARVFYCTMVGKRIMILHMFIKKTSKTPKKDLEIARRRQKEVTE